MEPLTRDQVLELLAQAAEIAGQLESAEKKLTGTSTGILETSVVPPVIRERIPNQRWPTWGDLHRALNG
jgi:hypothetical protein